MWKKAQGSEISLAEKLGVPNHSVYPNWVICRNGTASYLAELYNYSPSLNRVYYSAHVDAVLFYVNTLTRIATNGGYCGNVTGLAIETLGGW